MSIIDTTVIEADSFGQLVLVDLDPARQEVERARRALWDELPIACVPCLGGSRGPGAGATCAPRPPGSVAAMTAAKVDQGRTR